MSKISEQRRREILSAAEAEFSVRGIEGASIAEIALRAGIGKSTIYEYFPSKSQLFAQVCQEKMRAITQSVREAFAADVSFRAQLTAYCRLLLELLRGVDVSTLMTLMNHPAAQELRKSVALLRDNVMAEIGSALRRGQARGEIAPDADVELAACYLVTLPNPHMTCYLQERGVADPVGQLVDLALQGLEPRREPGAPSSFPAPSAVS